VIEEREESYTFMPVNNTLFWLDFSLAEIAPESGILEQTTKTSKA
jgi:hypothetical protein